MSGTLTAPAPLRVTAMGPNDTRLIWLDIGAELPTGATPSNPTASVLPSPGGVNPLTAGSAIVDTGSRSFPQWNGEAIVTIVSPGPRIQATVTAANAPVGTNFGVVLGWADSEGQQVYRTININIVAR